MRFNEFPMGYSQFEDPTKFARIFLDFTRPSDYDETLDITVTETGSGTRAVSNAGLGELLITNAAANDDVNSLQFNKETVKLVSGKKLYFKVRVKISDATESDLVIGLIITDTSILAGVTDGVYFQKDDGDANLDFHVAKNSTATDTAAMTTLSDDTYAELSFFYDGAEQIDIFKDDVKIGSSAITNLPDDEDLTLTLLIQNGEAVAKTMTLDYILIDVER